MSHINGHWYRLWDQQDSNIYASSSLGRGITRMNIGSIGSSYIVHIIQIHNKTSIVSFGYVVTVVLVVMILLQLLAAAMAGGDRWDRTADTKKNSQYSFSSGKK